MRSAERLAVEVRNKWRLDDDKGAVEIIAAAQAEARREGQSGASEELVRLRELEAATLARAKWEGCNHPPLDAIGPCGICVAIFDRLQAATAACIAASKQEGI